jgi:hypothetical protein
VEKREPRRSARPNQLPHPTRTSADAFTFPRRTGAARPSAVPVRAECSPIQSYTRLPQLCHEPRATHSPDPSHSTPRQHDCPVTSALRKALIRNGKGGPGPAAGAAGLKQRTSSAATAGPRIGWTNGTDSATTAEEQLAASRRGGNRRATGCGLIGTRARHGRPAPI